ncbi:MAG: hypothetical protein WBC33_11165 [Conexibacter sp.]
MQTMRASSVRRAVAAFASTAVLLLAPAGAAASAAAPLTTTLRDAKTGFSIRVPSGFTLKQRTGIYTIASGRLKLVYTRARTGQMPAQAGAAIARAARARTSKRTTGKRSFRATLTNATGTRVLEIRRSGKFLKIATYTSGSPRSRRAASAGPRARAAITAGEIALLRQIAATANGGRPIVLGSGVRLRPFTAQDGSATAFVPDLPGWQFNGLRGVIEGGNANQGAFAFGVTFFVQTPATFVLLRDARFPQAPGFLDAAGALTGVLPQWFGLCCNTQLANVQITGRFPGSELFLGAGYFSGFFTATFTLNGRPWQGIFLLGTNPTTGVDGTFFVYYSYVAVPVGAPPAIGASLLETWASWNPSADQARRRNETLATILTTRFAGGPIDQAVFDKAAADWSEYIRE